MDKQLALMKRYQKDENTIAYVHSNEILLIKKENTSIIELIIDPKTESVKSSRTLASSEMTLQQFDAMKKELTDTTTADSNSEQRNTYRNVSYDAIGDNIETSRPSVEYEYISSQIESCANDNLSRICIQLRKAKLTDIQLRRYIKRHYENKNTLQIAHEEGVRQNAVWESLMLADKKIKKIFEFFIKRLVKPPQKSIWVKGQ